MSRTAAMGSRRVAAFSVAWCCSRSGVGSELVAVSGSIHAGHTAVDKPLGRPKFEAR